MGDRALVIFHSADKSDVSPTIYLHWLGSKVPELIEKLKNKMADRRDDEAYAAARFCEIACAYAPGNLSIGLMETPKNIFEKDTAHSHGDAGVILVNADTFEWEAFGGYLADKKVATA